MFLQNSDNMEMELKKIETVIDVINKHQFFKDQINLTNKLRVTNVIYPNKEKVLRAFENQKIEEIKLIIIGQDPYHTPGFANGLAFGINQNTNAKLPPAPSSSTTQWRRCTLVTFLFSFFSSSPLLLLEH